jgi:hypothetical protein
VAWTAEWAAAFGSHRLSDVDLVIGLLVSLRMSAEMTTNQTRLADLFNIHRYAPTDSSTRPIG